jgi:nitronate monooxygenase
MSPFDSNRLFGLKTAIIQAPMAGVSTPELAAAVSNAGGLGSISIGASSLTEAKALIEKTRSLTNNPFNVNVFCHQKAKHDLEVEHSWINHFEPFFLAFDSKAPEELKEIYHSFLDGEEVLKLLIDQLPAFVSFHFGIPPKHFIKALHAAGIKTLASATSVLEADLVMESGIHGVIAQGIEAGGHRGIFDPKAPDEKLSTFALVSKLAKRCDRPLIAAGGIMDGQTIRDVMSLGANGVQLGTAFILCPESAASDSYRNCLKNANSDSTKLTSVISGRPARGIINRFMIHGEASGAPQIPDYPIAYDLGKRLSAATTKKGDFEFSAFWSGASGHLARELSAKDLIAVLLNEMCT